MDAIEVNPPKQPGYRISSKVAPSIYAAYLDVLERIKDAMARKHIYWDEDAEPEMFDGFIAGIIVDNGIVVDGQLLGFAELQKLLEAKEGLPIKISIRE